MMKKRVEDSEPFNQIWEKAINPVISTVNNECDTAFIERCNLKQSSTNVTWKQELYDEYRCLRTQLKDTCYGPSDQHKAEELLDGRKIAAILCASLIRKKCFQFDIDAAKTLAEEKKQEFKAISTDPTVAAVKFNTWAAQNIYINYKLAYYVSLQMVYLTLMHDLLDRIEQLKKSGQFEKYNEAVQLVHHLNSNKHLCSYPPPQKGDGFDVNIIIGLAREDVSGKNLDMFLFAMHLYQIEEHTIDELKLRLGSH